MAIAYLRQIGNDHTNGDYKTKCEYRRIVRRMITSNGVGAYEIQQPLEGSHGCEWNGKFEESVQLTNRVLGESVRCCLIDRTVNLKSFEYRFTQFSIGILRLTRYIYIHVGISGYSHLGS